MDSHFDGILGTVQVARDAGDILGLSREGRQVRAFRFGSGTTRVSLLGGCHADEPVGPRMLRHLTTYLGALPADDPLLRDHEWWIVPHVNPDGEERNRQWHTDHDPVFDPARFLKHQVRELPGDDIEFGFPYGADDDETRPENRAAYDWWSGAEGPFDLHVTLHGMGFAAGPWYLIDAAWRGRVDTLMSRCAAAVRGLGYSLHDVERNGEKGFERIAPGFCTRPNSVAMRDFFLARGDEVTAARFRPSSMEAMRALSGDPLTLVSEMPLFITPGVGETLGPPDPAAERWKEQREQWRLRLHDGADEAHIRRATAAAGLVPMPVRDQMRLQWNLICSGLEQVAAVSWRF